MLDAIYQEQQSSSQLRQGWTPLYVRAHKDVDLQSTLLYYLKMSNLEIQTVSALDPTKFLNRDPDPIIYSHPDPTLF